MKKTSEKIGAGVSEPKVDYFKLFSETPKHLRKRISMQEMHETVQKAREEKLKKTA